MKNKIRFSKLLCLNSEEGYEYKPSIIAYRKIPNTMENVDMGNGKGKTIVKTYRRVLYINLWLLELNFSWIK